MLKVIVCVAVLFAQDVCTKKLMSFNVGLTDRIEGYDDRKEAVVNDLKNSDADAVCLQEVWYGDDVERIREQLKPHWNIYTPPLSQNKISFGWLGSIDVPPCAALSLITLKLWIRCRHLETAEAARCAQRQGLLRQHQRCITCLAVCGGSCLKRCLFDDQSINIPGIMLLVKKPLTASSVSVIDFEPVKQMIKRSYIEAQVSGVGKVICTHLTANLGSVYYEALLKNKYSSWAEHNLADALKITNALNAYPNAIVFGDLNTSPRLTAQNISADLEGCYDHFISNGYTSPYVDLNGKCTYCRNNPLVAGKWDYNNILDHVMIKGHTARSAKRFYTELVPTKTYPVSDHYAVEVEID